MGAKQRKGGKPRRMLMARLNRSMRVVELGPLASPIAPKSEGWQVTVVDVKSRDQLAREFNYVDEIGKVEPVDVVWEGAALEDAIPNGRSAFDAVIASHVLEHMTDPVAFLRSASELLKPGGRVLLLLPDKRKCFDYFRPITMTGDLIEANLTGHVNHTHRTAFNHLAYAVRRGAHVSWSGGGTKGLSFVANLPVAYERAIAHAGRSGKPGFDFHAWCFVPSSFELIIYELSHLGVIDLEVEEMSPSIGAEFFCSLRRRRPQEVDLDVAEERRYDLLRRAHREASREPRTGVIGRVLTSFGV